MMLDAPALADVRWQLRINGTAEDEDLGLLIERAQSWVEQTFQIVLDEREVVETFDRLGPLRLAAWPVAPNAAVSINYLDAQGVSQTQATYRLVAARRPAMLLPAIGSAWPQAVSEPGSVTVHITAGYASPDAVPEVMKQAMLMLIGGWYSDREGGDVASGAERVATMMLSNAGYRLMVV